MLQTTANPDGVPIAVFDGIRAGVAADRSQFYKDLAVSFYGYNREGAKTSQGVVDAFWLRGSRVGSRDNMIASSNSRKRILAGI